MSLYNLGKALFRSAPDPKERLRALFPSNNSTLTDSGRSALGFIIEAVGLEHSRIVVPAFLCTNVLPVLRHYDITPIFVDVNKNTYAPILPSSFDDYDAVLLVATYGVAPDTSLIKTLEKHNKTIIEDYAHAPLPSEPTSLTHPRLYSFAKTLPVPNGGLAILPPQYTFKTLVQHPPWTLTSLKNTLKLWRACAICLMWLRIQLRHTTHGVPMWSGIKKMSRTTFRLLGHALAGQPTYTEPRAYCVPMPVENPNEVQRRFFAEGIITERIWHPIITDATTNGSRAFPNALHASAHLLCAPLWHITSRAEKTAYDVVLKEKLSGNPARMG